MKKVLKSVFLAFIMALLFFSVSASANESTRLGKWSAENFDPENGLSVKQYMVLDNMGYIELLQEAHIKGEKITFTSKINNLDVKFIIYDDTFFAYLPKFPFIHIKTPAEGFDFDALLTPDSSEESRFLQSYETTLYSRSYYVEEFLSVNEYDEELIIKAYFIGDELKFMEHPYNIDGYNVTLRTEILSINVDDKVFKVPFFSINIYPLIKFFFNNISDIFVYI